MVQVYIVQLKEKLHPKEYEQLYHWVSIQRRQKTDRLKQEADRVRSLLAGALLKYVLLQKGMDGEKEVQTGAMGKPFLKEFEFNISHGGPFVALAFGKEPVGVDVEGGRPVSEKVAARFHPEEVCWYEKLAPVEKEIQFYRIWTAKESVMKRDGRGLAMNMASFSIFSDVLKKELHSVQLDEKYWLTICSKEEWDGKLHFFEWKDLLL